MNNTLVSKKTILPMSNAEIAIMKEAESYVRENLDKVKCITNHTLHAGIYTRTLFLPKGCTVVGVVIKLDTTLILSGNMNIFIGKEVKHIKGIDIIPTKANRKQMFYALEDSFITMSFCTTARTVEEAEIEMTDEVDNLQSREPSSINIINITEV